MPIGVTVAATGTGRRVDMYNNEKRYASLSITGLTAGADNTIPHGLPYTPARISYRPAKVGTTPGGWTETQAPDGTNLYLTVNTNGSTSGIIDVEE